MVSLILTTGISLFTILCTLQFRTLRQNITKAKQSGLPYVVSPLARLCLQHHLCFFDREANNDLRVYFQTIWWLILQEPLLPLLNLLPKAWTESWLP